MTEKKHNAGKAPALILTLGGAPNVPHTVDGVYGTFRPDRPTPVGGPGEPTLQQAKDADKNPGVPLELIQIPEADVQGLRKQADADRRADQGLAPRQTTEEEE